MDLYIVYKFEVVHILHSIECLDPHVNSIINVEEIFKTVFLSKRVLF